MLGLGWNLEEPTVIPCEAFSADLFADALHLFPIRFQLSIFPAGDGGLLNASQDGHLGLCHAKDAFADMLEWSHSVYIRIRIRPCKLFLCIHAFDRARCLAVYRKL